jgi:hypothetical protein
MGHEHISAKRINWDYLYGIIRKQYGGVMEFQRNVLKKDGSYYNKIQKGLLSYGIAELEKTVDTLKIDQRVLFPELADMPDVLMSPMVEIEKSGLPEPSFDLNKIAKKIAMPFDITELESGFEKTVRKMLDDISTKMEMLLELESKVNAINDSLTELIERIPKPDMAKKAEEILREFAGQRGHGGKACEFKLYMEELERRGVPRSFARDALNRVGATLESVGYGKEKTMWVIMPEDK